MYKARAYVALSTSVLVRKVRESWQNWVTTTVGEIDEEHGRNLRHFIGIEVAREF